MSQYPPQYPPPLGLNYSSGAPLPSRRPKAVTVLAIIGIIWASLGVLGGLCNVLLLFVQMPAQQNPTLARIQSDPFLHSWTIAGNVLSFLLSLLLLAAAIGAMQLRRWSRTGMITWAITTIVLTFIQVVVSITMIAPHLTDNMPANPAVRTGAQIGYWGVTLFILALLIYPIFVIVYLRRPEIRMAFESDSPGTSVERPPQDPYM